MLTGYSDRDARSEIDQATLPKLLHAAPAAFRCALKASRLGADADLDDVTLLSCAAATLQQASQCLCDPAMLVACRTLTVEASGLGGAWSWNVGLQTTRTEAQASCYLHRLRQWLAAREIIQSPIAKADDGDVVSMCEITLRDFKSPGYVQYDNLRFNFSELVLRMLAETAQELNNPAAASEDALSQLHNSITARQEVGWLHGAHDWASQGLVYSKELDDATRYGCGVFNRAFKASALRGEFIALYERFIAEVISPMLGSAALVYQAVPVFRVFFPGHLGVGPRHTDAAYHKQPNEINVWVPLTPVSGSNSLMVESSPGAADFAPITCNVGTLYHFRGNSCEHFTDLNVSDTTRVSFDFRVIRGAELHEHPVHHTSCRGASGVKGAGEYFTIGRYYKSYGSLLQL